jgi:ketosteroid isomerase-like protein
MQIARRHLALGGAVALAATQLPLSASAENGEVAAVNQAVEALRKAMVDADKAKLAALTHDQLSYGHSSGRLETKTEYVEVVASKKTIYKSLTLSEPSAAVVGNNAIVRHIFAAEVETDGKPNSARVGVMQVWVKDGGWKLLARQAFRLAT